jgi:hypothetical protein
MKISLSAVADQVFRIWVYYAVSKSRSLPALRVRIKCSSLLVEMRAIVKHIGWPLSFFVVLVKWEDSYLAVNTVDNNALCMITGK